MKGGQIGNFAVNLKFLEVFVPVVDHKDIRNPQKECARLLLMEMMGATTLTLSAP